LVYSGIREKYSYQFIEHTAAIRFINSDILLKESDSKGIIIKAFGGNTLVEEAPLACKDMNDVVVWCITPGSPGGYAKCARWE